MTGSMADASGDAIVVRVLAADEAAVLDRVAPEVFDGDVDPASCAAFFADPRHHLAVAIDRGVVVAMASGVDYVHPDKPRDLWINEVGVSPSHHGRGIGRRVVDALLDHGRALGCGEAWVLTSPTNTAARRLYAGRGGEEADEPAIMYTFPL